MNFLQKLQELDAYLVEQGSKITDASLAELLAKHHRPEIKIESDTAVTTEQSLLKSDAAHPQISLPTTTRTTPATQAHEITLPHENIAIQAGETMSDIAKHTQVEQKLEKAGLDQDTAVRITEQIMLLETPKAKGNHISVPKFSDHAIELMAFEAKNMQSSGYKKAEEINQNESGLTPLSTPQKDRIVAGTGLAAMGKVRS